MKNFNSLTLSLTLIILMLTSASSKSQEITGNGNVVKETRSLGSFNEIITEGVLNVYLSQGSTESVIIETDQNLIPYIITKVSNNILTIKNKDDAEIEKSEKMNVYVTLKDISKLETNGVGKVETLEQLILGDLKISNGGVGNTKLNLKCSRLSADINSVGNLTLTGDISDVKIEHNGVGSLKAENLNAEILRIESNGVGSAEVNSSKELYINLNGIGNISYKGAAVIKELNINGMGKVTKM